MIDFSKIQRALVFGAHPDDECIGPGGLMRKLANQGTEVVVVTFTGGETAAKSTAEGGAMKLLRAEEMAQADRILGVNERVVLGIPTTECHAYLFGNQTREFPGIAEPVTGLKATWGMIRRFRPDLLLTHYFDAHLDHKAIAEITLTAVIDAQSNKLSGLLGMGWTVPLVMRYEVGTDLERTDVVFPLTEQELEAKINAIGTQGSQASMGRFQRSARRRAETLGERYACGLAEAYELVRPIVAR